MSLLITYYKLDVMGIGRKRVALVLYNLQTTYPNTTPQELGRIIKLDTLHP
jgi:hypothetical protein